MTITGGPAAAITIEPSLGYVAPRGFLQFRIPGPFQSATWTVTGAENTIFSNDDRATLIAGATAGQFQVTATSVTDPTRSASAMVVVSIYGRWDSSLATTHVGHFTTPTISRDCTFCFTWTLKVTANSVTFGRDARTEAPSTPPFSVTFDGLSIGAGDSSVNAITADSKYAISVHFAGNQAEVTSFRVLLDDQGVPLAPCPRE